MTLRCAWCHSDLGYVHGHAACLRGDCAMFGLNQSECCSGEVGVTATSDVGRAPTRPDPGVERPVPGASDL